MYNESGTLLTDDRYGQYGTGNVNARIIYTFSTTGTYFVLVRDDWAINWQGTFSVRVLPKYNEGGTWDPANDDEPNAVLPLAFALEVGAENAQTHQLFNYANYVTNGPDYDFYHFYAQPGTYLVQTFGVQAAGRATGLWLYNAAGEELVNDAYGDNETGQAEIEFTFITAGEYFLLVKNAPGYNWLGTYSVRVCENVCLQSVFLPIVVR